MKISQTGVYSFSLALLLIVPTSLLVVAWHCWQILPADQSCLQCYLFLSCERAIFFKFALNPFPRDTPPSLSAVSWKRSHMLTTGALYWALSLYAVLFAMCAHKPPKKPPTSSEREAETAPSGSLRCFLSPDSCYSGNLRTLNASQACVGVIRQQYFSFFVLHT